MESKSKSELSTGATVPRHSPFDLGRSSSPALSFRSVLFIGVVVIVVLFVVFFSGSVLFPGFPSLLRQLLFGG